MIMRKNFFKIAISLVFSVSVFNGTAQTEEKPVLERHSSSSQMNKEEPFGAPELKKNSLEVNKNSNDFREQAIAPELKRFDSSPTIKKEQPKNSK
jgi:hypothetical protein